MIIELINLIDVNDLKYKTLGIIQNNTIKNIFFKEELDIVIG